MLQIWGPKSQNANTKGSQQKAGDKRQQKQRERADWELKQYQKQTRNKVQTKKALGTEAETQGISRTRETQDWCGETEQNRTQTKKEWWTYTRFNTD